MRIAFRAAARAHRARSARGPERERLSDEQSTSDLESFYFGDERISLLPVEELDENGLRPGYARRLDARRPLGPREIALFDEGFRRYWQRTLRLAQRSPGFAPPRRRHVVVVHEPDAVRPYASLLNTTAWTLYACDLAPDTAHPELVAFLLRLGDRMGELGEVTRAALWEAPYFFDRDEEECAAFARAAESSTRPDADALRALARALPWLRRLHHVALRPAPDGVTVREIPGSGLLVPEQLLAEPPALVAAWEGAAREIVTRFHARWHGGSHETACEALCSWLEATRPPLLLRRRGRNLWHPGTPSRLQPVRDALIDAVASAIEEVQRDLVVMAERTSHFVEIVGDPLNWSPGSTVFDPGGYACFDAGARLLAYDLEEPGIERLLAPPLPFARWMLGARCAHELGHAAVDAGYVPQCVTDHELQRRIDALSDAFERAVCEAPLPVRTVSARDLEQLSAGRPPGEALAHFWLTRLPDDRANALALPLLRSEERETYVRHNVRSLGLLVGPGAIWRRLARYLLELQYLRFSAITDARTFFLVSTGFADEFLASALLREDTFDQLVSAGAALCAAYAVDLSRLRRWTTSFVLPAGCWPAASELHAARTRAPSARSSRRPG